ncbi:MAG: DNRLRE domain-containing protein, partial [Acidimicrobiia bacterium]
MLVTVAVVLGVLAFPGRAAAASTFQVNALADGVDTDVGDGSCETAVPGQCTLRAALQEANATATHDVIVVPAGSYVLTIPPSGDNGAGTGDLDVTAPVTLTGAGSATTTVSVAGPAPGSPPELRALDRLLELHPAARNATISGVTFSGGYDAVAGGAIANAATGVVRLVDVAVLDSFATDEGGGIHNIGSLVLDRVNIAGNETGGSGGGIFTSGGSVTIVGTATAPSVISSNTAGSGGGIYDGGELSPAGLPSRLDVRHTTIADNLALDTGGGVLVDQEARLIVADARFDSNGAEAAGGGLAVQQKASADLARVTFVANTSGGDGGGALSSTEGGFDGVDLDFTANRAGASLDPEPDGSGGGLFTDGGGAVDVSASSFVANAAASDGGGLYVDNFGSVEVTDVEMSDNAAGGVGGGIENSGNNVTFRRLDVFDNHAEESGGGIHSSGSGLLNVVDSEIHRNLAQTGGGMTNDADGGLVVRSTTIHENRASVGSAEESGLGGGIFVLGDAGISIENTTISGNQAQVRGGGLYSDSDAGLHVANATIVNNSAPLASGVGGEIGSPNFPVYPSTSVMFRNTIIAGNLLSPSCSFALGSEGGNIDSGTSCYFQGPGDRTNTTPEYDALGDNGGPTPTHALTETSIAVDSGVACLATDQRGVERPQNERCDSGAYEWEGPFAPEDTDLPDTFFDGGPVQDTEATALFYFHGTDATTPAGLLQFECRLLEFDPTEVPEIPDPTQPPDPELLFVPCPSPWQVPIVEEGDYRFEVRAIDRAGNPDPSPAVHEFTGGLDFTGPETFIDEMPPASGAGRSAVFTFSATDNVTPSAFLEFECRLDTTEPDAWLECTNPATFSDLTVGTHRFDVRAVDGNDNIGPTESWTWEVGIPADDCDAANVALTPVADTLVDEALPSTSFGAEPFALTVRSGQAEGDARTLVRFPITDDAPDCTLASATLRLYGDGDEGRTLEARPLAAGFSEATATWNLQPAAGAPDATALSGAGYRDWDVTARVASILHGSAPNFGWQISDAVRNDPEGAAQSFHSRETPQEPGLATRPRLVLRVEPSEGPPPPPPPAPDEPTEPPVSLVCGARVTESIRLANDLLGCLGEGLIIGAPNIVVDLDGHRITSGLVLDPGEEDGLIAGIRNAGYENVTIRDGSVEGFGYGVRLLGSTAYGVVHDMQLRGNVLAGVELFDADNG